MNILILGAAGFIGTNLALGLIEDEENTLTLADERNEYFDRFPIVVSEKSKRIVVKFDNDCPFETLVDNQDIVYHLISTNNPSTSNRDVVNEISDNISLSIRLLEACVKKHVGKVVFISSGGTVYGNGIKCPIKEDTPNNPITTYGIQKLTIEKLLYLYFYMYGLDYRVVRLSNPYGPYQRPSGKLGAITNFIYKALKNESIVVYGDGTVVRDYIYIDDAIRGIIAITKGNSKEKIFNLGSGRGTSINYVLETLERQLNHALKIEYTPGRTVDVKENYLDIGRYESEYGKLNPIALGEGMGKLENFMREYYKL
ncbi:MAG: NAD-dependent epimerase/dehydratase family protein [Lachnospiraceae bacterium]|nr:NAD-dependent epimerase/dehydratase family protein [Lachnospiraceae bacterium]